MAACRPHSTPQPALRTQIPEPYHRLVPDVLLDFTILETKANCADCSMSREHRGPRAKLVYQPNLKCCTFDPWVPNYAVGALLRDPKLSSAGRQAVAHKIKSMEECIPLGLRASTVFQRRFLRRKEHEFGNREDWLCPYFDSENQNCGIWQHRGNVCASFFCQSDAGTKGMNFWRELGSYLHLIEMSVAEECLVQLDFSPRQLSEMLAYIDPQTHLRAKVLPALTGGEWRKLWNGYEDPQEFFVKCDRIVQGLKLTDMPQILGEAGERAWSALEKRMRLLQPTQKG